MIKNKARKRSSVHQKYNILSTIRLSSGVHNFDRSLEIFFGKKAPNFLYLRGNPAILDCKKLAFFCSKKCPGEIITATYDIMKNIRNQGIVVISGFHSPMEQECLRICLKKEQPTIMIPARSIENMRLSSDLKAALNNERLLILSPFSKRQKRMTAQNALKRNYFATVIADMVFIAHASPGSKTEAFCNVIKTWQKSMFTIDSEYNKNIIEIGCRPITSVDHFFDKVKTESAPKISNL